MRICCGIRGLDVECTVEYEVHTEYIVIHIKYRVIYVHFVCTVNFCLFLLFTIFLPFSTMK